MKKNFPIIAIVAIIIVCIVVLVNSTTSAEEKTTEETTIVETTAETITKTETVEITMETTTSEKTTKAETTQIYENTELFKEVRVLSSELPFVISGVDAVEVVKLYIPREHIGDEDVWENAYIVVEAEGQANKLALKFNKADGMYVGNLVSKQEQMISNLTFVYCDGNYSEEYEVDEDGDILTLKNFNGGCKSIKIHNRSAFPIFEGKIANENVVVNDIIIKLY